jgi:ABC-type molybdenum transport system ATPase subunit/photorepair protein PhrA
MGHNLIFQSVHKSITGLVPIELPAFTVLTGRNGSGKTHLLTAITEGKVASSIVTDVKRDVRFFDWQTIVPKDTGVFDPWQDQSKRSGWFTQIQTQRNNAFPGLQQYVISLGVPAINCSSVQAVESLTVEKLRTLLAMPEQAEETYRLIRTRVRKYGAQVGQNTIGHIGDQAWRQAVPTITETDPESFALSSQTEFFRNPLFLWGEVDAFQQAFGKVFTAYRELLHDNLHVREWPPSSGSKQKYLADDEFKAAYGEPPWVFVNRILEVCKLDFRVDFPPLQETGSYEPKLTKQTSGVEMKFVDLSSGERVLMSFALCLYNTEDKRQAKNFPKLLLLDEVDAPLHPSMTASLLKTIQEVLVDGKAVSVILTTHSPSTVAMAPEESIYAMNPDGPRVEKVSKSSALSILTTGVPTLSISFTGRRQVFVESATDAELYDALYQRYKGRIPSERSLQFVEVGRKDSSGGEKNAGCEQVIRLVEALADGGNQSVLGLVDWDGSRTAKGRVHVLSPAVRDGLESLLFDPVLLLSLVAREQPGFAQSKGLINQSESYVMLPNWEPARWQTAVNSIQALVMGPAGAGSTQRVEYLGGLSLDIRLDYITCDDHALESKITQAFGFLAPKNARAGGLMRHVIATVLNEFPQLLPRDLLDTFESLLAVEV